MILYPICMISSFSRQALGHFYGSSVNYDDAAVTDAIKTVKDHINDFKTQLDDSRDNFDNSCWGFYGLFIVVCVRLL